MFHSQLFKVGKDLRSQKFKKGTFLVQELAHNNLISLQGLFKFPRQLVQDFTDHTTQNAAFSVQNILSSCVKNAQYLINGILSELGKKQKSDNHSPEFCVFRGFNCFMMFDVSWLLRSNLQSGRKSLRLESTGDNLG